MPWRMLEYYGLLYRQFQQPPWQQVLAIGPGGSAMADRIEHQQLQYRYEFLEMAELPSQELLRSDSLADNLLGLLCQLPDPRAAFGRTLRRVRRLPAKKQADVMAQLLILSKLRPPLQSLVEEYRDMPFPIPDDLLDDPFFAPVVTKRDAKNRLLGERAVLRRLLIQRFGSLSEQAESLLDQASAEQLEQWSLRLLDAVRLEDVFRP